MLKITVSQARPIDMFINMTSNFFKQNQFWHIRQGFLFIYIRFSD